MKLTSSRAIWERVPGFRNHVAATLVFLGVELRLNLLFVAIPRKFGFSHPGRYPMRSGQWTDYQALCFGENGWALPNGHDRDENP